MLIHSVYFWLTEESKGSVNEDFERALNELLKIEHISAGWYGTPAATEERAVTDHSFDFALVLQFDTESDHDAYQVHPDHDAFVERWREIWDQVQVYDTEAK